MMLPPPLIARDLKARADLVVIASQFTRLRRSGRQLVGLCPLHKERNPSFYVSPEKRCFKCFGCGAGGDVFEFVMRATGCDFRRALEIVAEVSKGVARGRGGGTNPPPRAPRSGALSIASQRRSLAPASWPPWTRQIGGCL
jgi:hypothetical protein